MNKLTKQITIGISEEDECAISISPDMDAATALQLVGTLALHILKAFTTVATNSITSDSGISDEEKKIAIKGITDSMYDAMDNVFSTVLQTYQPDHPKYSLEDEAIIELTNAKIEEEYNKLPAELRSKYSQAYTKMRLGLQYRKDHNIEDPTRSTSTTDTDGPSSTKTDSE